MKKYGLVFAMVYAVILVICLVLKTYGGGMNIGQAIVAACVVSYIFVKDQGKAPNKIERRKLAGISVLMSFIVSGVLVAVICAFSTDAREALTTAVSQVSAAILAGALLVITLIYYTGLILVYNFVSAAFVKSLQQTK